MKQVNIHEAKTHLSRLIEAAAKGEGFIIAKAGKPMVRVVAIEDAPPVTVSKRIGWLKDTGLAEWWDSLDHETLDREIADSFLGAEPWPDDKGAPR
jgi:prevent-host-death family protein